eukprot:g15660.t1
MRYPEDVDELSHDEVDDLKRHRYDVSDVLRDVCRILGGVECLRQVVFLLKQELATLGSLARPDEPGGWQAVEACLFAVRSMGKDVPNDEETLVPQVVTMLPRLPANSHVRYTAALIVGKYAEWLKLHPEHLTAMFNFLMEGFASPDVMPAATTAIKPLIAHLVGTFNVVPHSSCLYCGSICVTEFGRRGPDFAAMLFQMLGEFAQAVFRCLQTLDDFTANPDVVEEFFYLVGRFVDYCPEPLVSRCAGFRAAAFSAEWLVQTLGALDVKIADNFQKQELMEKLFGPQADKSKRSFDDAHVWRLGEMAALVMLAARKRTSRRLWGAGPARRWRLHGRVHLV